MFGQQLFYIKVLLKRLGIVLVLYALCRILFFIFNRDLFPHIPPVSFVGIMISGLRFDISSIIYVNTIFIFLHIVPNPWRDNNWYQRASKILFYVFNGVALLLEAGDFIYFRYGLKRTSTHELGLANDTSVLPQVFKDYWIVFLIAFLLIVFIEWLYRKTEFQHKLYKIQHKIHYPIQGAMMIVVLGLCVLGGRGGFQTKPISPNSAALYVHDARLMQLVINTPFSVIYAFGHRQIPEYNYFSDEELKSIYSAQHENTNYYAWPDSIKKPNQPENVVVIVLESFSKEYIGYFNHGNGYTPFLDSLLQQGLCYSNFYSCGKSSNQGITAVTAGIPVLMEEPFISSLYQNNAIEGIGSLLKTVGYSSSFFHGANNGSMAFDRFMAQCGVENYFGRNEYGNDADFDGNWGIFDEPFLQWTANKMSELPVPFYSEIFTISSHHPFKVPDQYIGKFKKGSIPMLEVVGYADYALAKFFEEAKKQPWYNNTIFILTADHPGPPLPESGYYQEQLGAHATWCLIYKANGQFKGIDNRVAQQSDIMPTVLDYVGYKGKYNAFGTSLFDTVSQRYAFNFHAGEFLILDNDFALQYNGSNTTGLFHYKQDSLEKDNLMFEYPEIKTQLENKIKAIIQIHNFDMVQNQLNPE